MSHSSEKRWLELSQKVSSINQRLLHLTAVNIEEYERVNEVYRYCDNDNIKFANLLFLNDKDLTDASALQITMATELWASAKVWLENGDFMNNADVITKNRAKTLRNVS